MGTEVGLDHGGSSGGGGDKWLSSGCSVKALLIGLDDELDVACRMGMSRMGPRFWLNQIQMMELSCYWES